MSNERIDRLEERLAWLMRHVTEQDKAMLELSEELARLRREVGELRERATSTGGAPGDSDLPTDERPPHY